MLASTALTSIGAMLIRWIREKASNWLVSLAPRRADFETGLGDPLHPGIVGAAGDDLQPTHDRGQQIVEIVSDASGQPADRLHLLRLPERFLGTRRRSATFEPPTRFSSVSFKARRRRFRLLGFGDVVGDADEADMFAGRPPARLRFRPKPAPLPVGATIPPLQHERLEGRLARQRLGQQSLGILGMDDGAPVEVERLLIRHSQELRISDVDEAALAVELGHPHRHRRGIRDQPEPCSLSRSASSAWWSSVTSWPWTNMPVTCPSSSVIG